MTRQYYPEEIRDIGARACPAIADSYEEFASLVRTADLYKDRILGTHPNGDLWTSLFDLFKMAVTETPISLNAMGRALVEVADGYDEDEQQTVVDFNAIGDDLDAGYGRERQAILEEKAEEAEAEERNRRENRYGGGRPQIE